MLAHPVKLRFIDPDLTAANVWAKMCPRNHDVPLPKPQHHIIDPTNLRRALDDGVEHRLHVRRRAADDAEHLGRRRLMLQRLAQFRVALAEFFEQSHVFDGDHRLIGKCLKRPICLSVKGLTSVRRIWITPMGALSHQWHARIVPAPVRR